MVCQQKEKFIPTKRDQERVKIKLTDSKFSDMKDINTYNRSSHLDSVRSDTLSAI